MDWNFFKLVGPIGFLQYQILKKKTVTVDCVLVMLQGFGMYSNKFLTLKL